MLKCVEDVISDSWHWHKCNRPAKFIKHYTYSKDSQSKPLCGIHARFYKGEPSLEKIEATNNKEPK